MCFKMRWTTFKKFFFTNSKWIHTPSSAENFEELLQELYETGKEIFCCLNNPINKGYFCQSGERGLLEVKAYFIRLY